MIYPPGVPARGGCGPQLPAACQIPGDTSCRESFEWALRRLRDCTENHHLCSEYAQSPLPKRVLDLGGPRDSEVRLLTSEGEIIRRCVCLSHCWGTMTRLRTFTTNLDSHASCIPWDSLPPTYRDAVRFVRRLDIRYLWIDSLCIIQDDGEDWRREASKMASIFEGAYHTVAATYALSTTEPACSPLPAGTRVDLYGCRV